MPGPPPAVERAPCTPSVDARRPGPPSTGLRRDLALLAAVALLAMAPAVVAMSSTRVVVLLIVYLGVSVALHAPADPRIRPKDR